MAAQLFWLTPGKRRESDPIAAFWICAACLRQCFQNKQCNRPCIKKNTPGPDLRYVFRLRRGNEWFEKSFEQESELKFRLSRHAEEELARRNISRILLDEVLQWPEQIIAERNREKVYQSQVDFGAGKIYLVRVIVDDTVSPAIVVTVYRTSQIRKYWRE